MKTTTLFLAALALSASALAKLPAPSEEAKAKAAEAAAKTAHTGKVDAYLLCKSQNKVAAQYRASSKATGKPMETPPCNDPGAFAYKPAEPAAASAAATAKQPAAPAADDKSKKKT